MRQWNKGREYHNLETYDSNLAVSWSDPSRCIRVLARLFRRASPRSRSANSVSVQQRVSKAKALTQKAKVNARYPASTSPYLPHCVKTHGEDGRPVQRHSLENLCIRRWRKGGARRSDDGMIITTGHRKTRCRPLVKIQSAGRSDFNQRQQRGGPMWAFACTRTMHRSFARVTAL
jgi:hypothetical protein